MTPGEMLDDKKLKELQNLEADQKALLRADDENMTRDIASSTPAPSEEIGNIQRAERKLECVQGAEEESILNDLIAVNLAAAGFYHQVADQSVTLLAEGALHDLERIHSEIVAGLGLAAYRSGNTKAYIRMTDRKTSEIFSRLRIGTQARVDLKLVNAIEDAENICVRIMEQALDSDEISMDVKMHVHEAVMMLHACHEHIHLLKSTILMPSAATQKEPRRI